MESRARAASQPHGLPKTGDLEQSTTPSTCHPIFTAIPSPQLRHLSPHSRPGSGESNSFLALSPCLAQSFLEITLAASVFLGYWPLGAWLWSQQLLPLVGHWCSRTSPGGLRAPGPGSATSTPPFSSNTSLTHPFFFQMEKKMSSWQGGLPPDPQQAGRNPLQAPVKPHNPDNCKCNLDGSMDLTVTSAWGSVPTLCNRSQHCVILFHLMHRLLL